MRFHHLLLVLWAAPQFLLAGTVEGFLRNEAGERVRVKIQLTGETIDFIDLQYAPVVLLCDAFNFEVSGTWDGVQGYVLALPISPQITLNSRLRLQPTLPGGARIKTREIATYRESGWQTFFRTSLDEKLVLVDEDPAPLEFSEPNTLNTRKVSIVLKDEAGRKVVRVRWQSSRDSSLARIQRFELSLKKSGEDRRWSVSLKTSRTYLRSDTWSSQSSEVRGVLREE